MKPQSIALTTLILSAANTVALPSLTRSVESCNTSTLHWGPCTKDIQELNKIGEPLDCATFEVPLDYTSPNATGKSLDLQLIRINATKEAKGSVLYNPGGPGESGVWFLSNLGTVLRDTLGGHFNVISFDTRGTGRTIPFACDKNSSSSTSGTLSRRNPTSNSLPQADVWPYIQNQSWQLMTAKADACFEAQQEFGRFIGTPFVARDMLAVVDALGESGQLWYWGTSYGTVIGQVFAGMFPDRVGRMLLDSNVVVDDYVATTTIGSPRDVEQSLDHLFSECVKAGPEFCFLANYSGSKTTAEDLRTAVQDLFSKLANSPQLPPNSGLSVTEFPYGGSSVLQLLKGMIKNDMEAPITYSNATQIISWALNGEWKKVFSFNPDVPVDPSDRRNLGVDAYLGISCSDSSFRVESPDDMYSIVQAHLAQSSFGDGLVAAHTQCARWRIQAAEMINLNALQNVKTSFPILFANGIYDPTTPLSWAWEVSARFRESRVLIHEGIGHGVFGHTSNCTNEAIARYFEDGKLPELGTRCKPNLPIFDFVLQQTKRSNTTG